MKNKRVLLATAVIATAGAVGAGATALADTSPNNSTNGQGGLVQKIADTFHLNKSDVQKVFNDYHQQRQADRRQHLKDNLDQKVKDGTITQDQETKILAKLDELQQQLKNDNQQDRRADRRQLFQQLQQWAKDNNINLQQVLPRPTDHHIAPDNQ